MIYLDNSATTRPYDAVIRTVGHYMEEEYGNPSSLHRMGLNSEKAVKKARRQIAHGLNGLEKHVIFTSGGTESDNLAIFGTAMAHHRRGNHILTTVIEHPAVLEACKKLEKQGFVVDYIPVDRCGLVNPQDFKNAITDQTILISMMHVNNEVGSIQPVQEIAAMKEKALLHIDCVQSFGKIPLSANLADLISISSHKIHGPKGIGALYATQNARVITQMVGGGQEYGLRSGTENVPGIAGFGQAAEMAMATLEKRKDHVSQLKLRLEGGIRDQISDILVNSPESPDRCSPYILNISFLGTRGEVLLHRLEQNEIYVSTGAACSSNKKGKSHVLLAMGRSEKEIEGALRFSFSEFNTIDQMDEVLDRLKTAVTQFRKLGSFR
jgi:cysteine desulfurase